MISSDFFLQASLAIIMLGLGSTLQISNFKKIVSNPKGFFIGLVCQVFVSPFTAFVIVKLLGVGEELAVGIVIVASCPGGPISNLIAHLCNADIALSVSLTSISSIICIVTTPLWINYAINYFLQDSKEVPFDAINLMLNLIFVVLIPIYLGILLNKHDPKSAKKISRPTKWISTVILIIAVVLILFTKGEQVLQYIKIAGVTVLGIHLLNLCSGYFIASSFNLPFTQKMTITIESGYQNNTLAFVIATSIFHNPIVSIPAAIYGLIKLLSAFILFNISKKYLKKQKITTVY